MLLSELETSRTAVITRVKGNGAFRKRITEMGFVKGKIIKVVKNAPLQDPVQYSLLGYEISLRRSEASMIEVSSTLPENPQTPFSSRLEPVEDSRVQSPKKHLKVALVGNPNCGKTSIFNSYTRLSEHVGNYGGVTVDIKLSKIEYEGYDIDLYDLPGTYSLTSYSPEEVFVRNFLMESTPDVVINVVDASNLERNLYLTTQLIDMKLPVVLALNMYDELRARGDQFNFRKFAGLLGIKVIPTVGTRGKGLGVLLENVIRKANEPAGTGKIVHIPYGEDLEESIHSVQNLLNELSPTLPGNWICSRYTAIKLLEGDDMFRQITARLENGKPILEKVEKEREFISNLLAEDPESLFTDSRYGFISGALKETFVPNQENKRSFSEKLDTFLTHKFLGIPLFFAFLWLIFALTFSLGQYPVQWIETGIEALSTLGYRVLPQGDLRNLIIDGVINGVGGVIVFLPNILILFFFISFMEDTGYMARAAFIMDKVMHKVGLHGKSFIPLVMGFGCNVPALMATRIIESRSNRILTMLILPFMSCSARLPVYILLIGAFFPQNQGTLLFGIYLTGIILAILSALIFKKLFFRKQDTPFVMELPPYRLPTLRNTSRHMWKKSSEYLKKIGGVIVLASIIVWGLNYYPKSGDSIISQDKNTVNTPSLNANENLFLAAEGSPEKPASYLERIGKTLQPAMEPMGFDWKITVSLLAGIPGKEIVVSSMGVIYQDENNKNLTLTDNLRNSKYSHGELRGQKVFSTPVLFALLMFILIYFPCVAVIATFSREAGSFGWGLFMIAYTTGLAWIMSFLTYKITQGIITLL